MKRKKKATILFVILGSFLIFFFIMCSQGGQSVDSGLALKEKIHQVYVNKGALGQEDTYLVVVDEAEVKAEFSDNLCGCSIIDFIEGNGRKFSYQLEDMLVKVKKNQVKVYVDGQRDKDPELIATMGSLSAEILGIIIKQQEEQLNKKT